MGVCLATAQRLGTAPQNVEKDFRACWTLDALFNGIEGALAFVAITSQRGGAQLRLASTETRPTR